MSGIQLYHNLGVAVYLLAALYVIYPFFRKRQLCHSCQRDTESVYSYEEGCFVRWCMHCDLYQ